MLQGYLETLAIKDLPDERRAEYLRIALRQSERLGKLVGDLFELTKLESDDAEARMEPFVLPELVQDNVQHFQLEAEGRGVTLRCPARSGPTHGPWRSGAGGEGVAEPHRQRTSASRRRAAGSTWACDQATTTGY